jgi:phenylalanyl-tRNA synthetase alpha chain
MTEIKNLQTKAEEEINNSKTETELNDIRVKYLGKTGLISELLKNLKNIPNEDKKEYGQVVNNLKNDVLNLIEEKKVQLLKDKIKQELKNTP